MLLREMCLFLTSLPIAEKDPVDVDALSASDDDDERVTRSGTEREAIDGASVVPALPDRDTVPGA